VAERRSRSLFTLGMIINAIYPWTLQHVLKRWQWNGNGIMLMFGVLYVWTCLYLAIGFSEIRIESRLPLIDLRHFNN